MDVGLARTILTHAYALDEHLARLDAAISQVGDPAVRKPLARSLADVMGIVAVDIIFPLTAEHPELDQDRTARPRSQAGHDPLA